LAESHNVSDYCIGADGEVASVCLFSQVEIKKIKTILLDYQSRTSVALLKVLCKEFWKIDPEFKEASVGYIDEITGSTAGLIIGDRALQQRPNFEFIYDLAEGWKQMTGLPFVFAAWVSNKKLDERFIEKFNAANHEGLHKLDKVIAENPCDYCNLEEYYTKHIQYMLDAEKKTGLKKFLGYISNQLRPQHQ
jgi:chorismate dehydratase